MDDFEKTLDNLLCEFYYLQNKDLSAEEKTQIETEVTNILQRICKQKPEKF
jgi:hypothetical protein